MKQIKLTQGKVALVDDEDFEYLNQFKWYAHKGWSTFYAVRDQHIDGQRKHFRMHRVIMNPSDNMHIDHYDHNGLNNQRSNLRIVTNQQNAMNQQQQKNGSSCFKGVSYCQRDKVWFATIKYNFKAIRIGTFNSEIESAIAYNQEAIKLFGDFAYLNKIPDKYKNITPIKKTQAKAKKRSQYPGITWHQKKWRARFQKNKKSYFIGYFNTEEEAYQAILKAKNII